MKITLWLVAGACFTTILISRTPAQVQTPASAQPAAAGPPIMMHFNAGTLIRAQLDTQIDTKKARVGDPVLAKTTDDLNSNPPGLATKGCKIIGHVVEVAPHQGDSPSTLRIAFDKMILKNNSEMALPALIQAVGFGDAGLGTSEEVPNSAGAPGSYIGARMPGANSAEVKLPFNAKGAIGMSGVTLSAGSAQDSVLTSAKHNIKLESTMQMILRTE